MKKKISAFRVAAAYIGTVIGAGFASGQEVLQFFARFGGYGLIGIILTTILFIVFGYIVMDLGIRLHSQSHLEIVQYSCGKHLGRVFDYFITFFLFGTFTTMVSGTGALLSQEFGIPYFSGNILMALLSAVTVIAGINGIIKANGYIVPFLLISVFCISAASIIKFPSDSSKTIYTVSGILSDWYPAAILYASYNIILSIAVIGPVGYNTGNRKAIFSGALLGSIGIGSALAMIYYALIYNFDQINKIEIPMAYLAIHISAPIKILYVLVVIAEIYTTAAGCLYGFVARIKTANKEIDKTGAIIAAVIGSLILSRFGFSNFIKYLYPAAGYAGIILLFCLALSKFKRR